MSKEGTLPSAPPLGTGARLLLTAAAAVVVLAGIKATSDLVVQVLFAAMISIACLPSIKRLRQWHVPEWLAVPMVVIGVLLVFMALSMIVANSISGFKEDVPTYKDSWKEVVAGVDDWVHRNFKRVDKQWSIKKAIADVFDVETFLTFLFSTASGALATVQNVLVVMLITTFMLFEATAFPKKLLHAFGGRNSERNAFSEATRRVTTYLSIKAWISLLTGGVVATMLTLLGIKQALFWGLVATMFNFIPNIGFAIAAVPVIVLAFLLHGLGIGIATFIGYGVIAVVGNLLEPRWMGQKLGLSTLVVFVSLLLWYWILGPFGMLLSVPLTVIVKIMLEHTEDLRPLAILLGPADPDSPARSRPSTARAAIPPHGRGE